jgi:hypothetical protein
VIADRAGSLDAEGPQPGECQEGAMTTIPTQLRQREILDAQLAQCRQADNSFSRGAVAALSWLTVGGPGR